MDGEERTLLHQVSQDLAFVKGQLADLPGWKAAAEARLQRLETGAAYSKGIAAAIGGTISLLVSGLIAYFKRG